MMPESEKIFSGVPVQPKANCRPVHTADVSAAALSRAADGPQKGWPESVQDRVSRAPHCEPVRMHHSRARPGRVIRALLIAGGTLAVILGAVGMFLPVLPTTPFLLLAAVCYSRSSARFYTWLITNRWCGAYIRNYREGRGVSRRHKVITIGLLWLTIGYTVVSAVTLWYVRILLLAIAAGVTVHLARMKTFVPDTPDPGRGRDDG